MEQYANRGEAGIILANLLKEYQNKPNTLIFALPRGGVPVAYEIAIRLNLPLDLYIVRKLGVPWHEELAMGAMGSGGIVFLNEELIAQLGISKEEVNQVIAKEEKELKRREILYRGTKPFPLLKGKTVIIVDDGIATGATMRVVIKGIAQQKPGKLILAIPVAAASTYSEMKNLVDDFICPRTPFHFYAVGQWYEEFTQTSDEEVIQLLSQANDAFLKSDGARK